MGLTGTLWFPLLTGCGAAYVPDPRDGPAVGRLARDAEVTIFVAPPDLYGRYLEQIPREDLTALRCALVGGDFASDALAQGFEEKFGLPLIEGYGLAEMTAVVALNIPDYIQGHRRQIGTKPGTVGHPLPGLVAKVVDPATGEIAAPDEAGALWIKGPSRMLGYADDPAAGEATLEDGWLRTGDTAAMDGDGVSADRGGGTVVVGHPQSQQPEAAARSLPENRDHRRVRFVCAGGLNRAVVPTPHPGLIVFFGRGPTVSLRFTVGYFPAPPSGG